MKTVVITGASTGIGRSTAVSLAERGFQVFAGVRKEADAQALADSHRNILPLLLDVVQPAQVADAVETVRNALQGQKLAGLVNNAGIANIAPLALQPLQDFDAHFQVNVVGVLRVTQAFLPLLGMDAGLAGEPGRIVNVTSVSGVLASPFLGAYAASKHAVEAVSDSLRRELGIYGIDVIAVGPGPVKTPIWDKAEEKNTSTAFTGSAWGSQLQRFSKAMLQAGREGLEPIEIARVIEEALIAASPRARYAPVAGRFRNFTLPSLLPKRIVDRALQKQFGLGIAEEP